MKTHATFGTAALAGATSLLFAAASVHAAPVPALPDTTDAASAVAWSPQGQQLLALTLALLAALVLMERLCAWRLRVRHRRAVAAPSLREALLSAPAVFAGPLAADFQ